MEMESLFTDQKWNILKSLTEHKYSPLQLAGKLNTTIANISQQMRLLEAADLVRKEKIQNRDRGKPRTLFSLSHDYAYLILAADNTANKRLLELNDFHKFILNIWFIDNKEMHKPLEKLYWEIEPYLTKVDILGVVENRDSVEIVIVSENPQEIEKKISAVAKKLESVDSVRVYSRSEALKLSKQGKEPFSSKFHILYNPDSFLSGQKEAVEPKAS